MLCMRHAVSISVARPPCSSTAGRQLYLYKPEASLDGEAAPDSCGLAGMQGRGRQARGIPRAVELAGYSSPGIARTRQPSGIGSSSG